MNLSVEHEDILRNVPIQVKSMATKTVFLKNILCVPQKKGIQVWTNMKVSKWWQNLNFCWNKCNKNLIFTSNYRKVHKLKKDYYHYACGIIWPLKCVWWKRRDARLHQLNWSLDRHLLTTSQSKKSCRQRRVVNTQSRNAFWWLMPRLDPG